MALMSGGTPDSNTNKPTTILALRLRAAFWPSVNSASFGILPAGAIVKCAFGVSTVDYGEVRGADEARNHCLLSRAALRFETTPKGVQAFRQSSAVS
jgi:hypothetical protein